MGVSSNRTRGNDFELKTGRFGLDISKKLFTEDGEVLEQAA